MKKGYPITADMETNVSQESSSLLWVCEPYARETGESMLFRGRGDREFTF
jgi:hypothetical protein